MALPEGRPAGMRTRKFPAFGLIPIGWPPALDRCGPILGSGCVAPLTCARYAAAVARRIFRFDSCRIDLAARELRREGELVALSPKVFDCIAWLIEHRERAVGRDELAAAVWGKADVADTQLVQAVLKARRAIGDTGEDQRAIRTIPRFGYRWVAPVEADEPAPAGQRPAAASPVAAPPPPVPPARPPRTAYRTRRGAALLLAAAAAGGGWLAWRHAATVRPAEHAAEAARAAIAVLPATIAAERDWAWLRLGVMDLVAGRLHEAGLAVVPSDNVVALLREAAPAEAAERAVRAAIAPQWTVAPDVRRGAAGWIVSLDLRGAGEERRVVEVADADPVAAARRAVGSLLPALGKADVAGSAGADDLVSRVRAALLGGDYLAAQRWLDAAPPSQRDAPEARLLRARADFGLGRFEAARDGFTQWLAAGEQAGPLLRAQALKGRAACAVRLSDLEGAVRDYDAALALLHGDGDPALEGQIYGGRGVARAMRGEDDGALADFARARIALQLAGDTLALAGVEMNEGALNGRRGRPAEALASFRVAEQHFARFDARNELAAALANQIEAHLALLEPARALAVGDRAQALAARLENPASVRLLAYWRASALAASGRLAEAGEQLDALTRAPGALADPGVLAMSRSLAAALALAAGDPRNAAALARQARDVALDGPWQDVRGEAWLTLVRALRALGRSDQAAAESERLSAWARQAADPMIEGLALLAQAEQAWGERRTDEAARGYAAALSAAERRRVPAELARVAVSWGTALLAAGELEAAGAVIGRVTRWAPTDYACAVLQAGLYRALGRRAAWQAALDQARALAGERAIPAAVAVEPGEALAAGN